LLTAGAVVAFALGPSLVASLEYDRPAVTAGQVWRLATCQWTHWSLDHLVWDGAVFLAIGAACEMKRRRHLLATVALSAIGVPIAVHCLAPGIMTFRGLSGVDSALFGLAATLLFSAGVRQRNSALAATAAFGAMLFAAKTAYELATPAALFVDGSGAGFSTVPLAHLVGFLIGTGVGISAAVRAVVHRRQLLPAMKGPFP
jgi:rhomboid family GlyGly-CTERM serine protease